MKILSMQVQVQNAAIRRHAASLASFSPLRRRIKPSEPIFNRIITFSGNRTRTYDRTDMSRLLYQLSYAATLLEP